MEMDTMKKNLHDFLKDYKSEAIQDDSVRFVRLWEIDATSTIKDLLKEEAEFNSFFSELFTKDFLTKHAKNLRVKKNGRFAKNSVHELKQFESVCYANPEYQTWGVFEAVMKVEDEKTVKVFVREINKHY